jgi:hypothetical protein
VLRRRRLHLAALVATYRRDGDPSYAKAELRALNWAIAVIEEARRRELLRELERVRVDA